MNSSGVWTMLLHVAEAVGWAPPEHPLSRPADHMDSQSAAPA